MLPTIAQILTPHLSQISERVVSLLQTRQAAGYIQLPKEQTSLFATSSTECIFQCMQEGTMEALEVCMDTKLRQSSVANTVISDVVEGFLQGKMALLETLRKESSDPQTLLAQQDAIEEFYIDVLSLIVERYHAQALACQKKEHTRTTLLLQASQAVTSDHPAHVVMENLARILAETVVDGCCSIFLLNPETNSLTPRAGWGYGSEACMLSAKGLRLCTLGNDLQTPDGNSYGLCSVNRESSAFAEILPEALRSGKTNVFPITNANNTVGLAILSSHDKNFVFDDDTKELVSGILNGVAVAIEHAANTKRTQRKLEESESLRRVANQLLSSPNADQQSVLTLICNEARKIVGGTGSAILLKEDDHLRYAYGTGNPQPPLSSFPLTNSKYGEIFLRGETTIIKDAQVEIPKAQRSNEVRTLIVVPLLEGKENIGLILVSNKKVGFDLEDCHIMEMFAAQAVLALRNARLAEQSEMIVVAEERQRLARELHDSVTQALYAANLCAGAAKRSLSAQKYIGAAEQLESLRGMTQQAMRDMRSLIFDLHPPELESEGLVGAIQSRLNAVEGRSGINPDITATGAVRRLPIIIEEELFRIAIEALNNTTKHSRATEVRVSLAYTPESITLAVSDNGKGYDIAAVPSGGVGLRSMRERAERISGELYTQSENDRGCLVRITVPLKDEGAA